MYKSNNKAAKHINSDYIHKDILIKAFNDVIQGKDTRLTSADTECSDVLHKWNEMINSLCESRRKTILDVNDLLQMVTRMDSVRDMIKSVNVQTEALHSMSASSEELSASIEDVSNMSQNTALESINLIDNSIDKANETIIQVAANTEEQTAVTQSFTSNILDLSQQANQINISCSAIGKVIYDLSKRIDSIRLEIVKKSICHTG